MAIFKISGYIAKFDPIATRHKKARHHLHYMITRKGKNGEEMQRQLFNREGDVDVGFALDLIANEKAHIFKIILSPDPKREDTKRDLNLEQLTRLVMIEIQERLGKELQFVAVMHDDHTDKRHIHSMVFLNGKLNKADLKHFRAYLTEQALAQRRERDRPQEQTQEPLTQLLRPRDNARQVAIDLLLCPTCRTQMRYLSRQLAYCPSCQAPRALSVGISQEVSWGR